MRVADKAECECCGKAFNSERQPVAIEDFRVIVCGDCRREFFREMDAHFFGKEDFESATASGEKAAQ